TPMIIDLGSGYAIKIAGLQFFAYAVIGHPLLSLCSKLEQCKTLMNYSRCPGKLQTASGPEWACEAAPKPFHSRQEKPRKQGGTDLFAGR
ncbi:MAG: hypothetical protein ACYCSH_16150, partial [Acidithiobacillus sp.]